MTNAPHGWANIESGLELMQDLPLYWRNEVSGNLERAVIAYVEGLELSTGDIVLLRAYFAQWVNVAVFSPTEELLQLRQSVEAIASIQDIHNWLEAAALIGIDPL